MKVYLYCQKPSHQSLQVLNNVLIIMNITFKFKPVYSVFVDLVAAACSCPFRGEYSCIKLMK